MIPQRKCKLIFLEGRGKPAGKKNKKLYAIYLE